MKEERASVVLKIHGDSFYGMSVRETDIHAHALLRSSLIGKRYINASAYNSMQIVYRSTG